MSGKSFASSKTILLLLIVTLVLMGCASGTPKIEAWKFDEASINGVRTNCSSSFPEAERGDIAGLWANKRAILKSARACSQAANILADQAENRNKVLGN